MLARPSNALRLFVPHNALNALDNLHTPVCMPFPCRVRAEFKLHGVFRCSLALRHVRAVLPTGSSLALCVWQHYYENPALGVVPAPC